MTRVVLLIPTLDCSGAEKQLTLLATRLPRDEFDVHVVCLTRGGPYADVLRDAGVPVTVLGKRWKFDPVAFYRLRRLLDELQPDILHTWLFAASAYGRLVVGRRPRAKIIVAERCVDSWKSGWQLWLDRHLIIRTARLVGNSAPVVDFYRDLGVPDRMLTAIPNGVEIPLHGSADRAALLAEFDLPSHAKVVGYIGRLARQKRIRDLVWGLQILRQLTEDTYLLIVGDGPEKERAIEHARHYECTRWLRLAGHRDAASDCLACMDVFWLASDFEGMSNSVMEAMAAGVPVVATDIPANRELVVDGETGFLVKVGDSAGLAQFADRILADPALARRLGAAGAERMRTEFSVERMVESHINLYRDVLADGRPDPAPAVAAGEA